MINIKNDSRKVIPGDIFIAIKGATEKSFDGHDFIEDAIKNGATKIIAEHGEYSVPTLIVENTDEYLTNYMKDNYQNILEGIKFVGITGTKGKTTTALNVHYMLKELGEKSAYIGTNGFMIDGHLVKELPNTTVDIIASYNLILEAKNEGVTTIVLEASSHALELKRLEGINFDVGAFTNLSRDHLDFHGTMENYLKAKEKILYKLKPNAKIVVNVDDPNHPGFINPNAVTIGKTGRHYKFDNIVLGLGKTEIDFTYNDKKYHIETNFSGEFNVYNYIMATAITVELGYDLDRVLELSKDIYPPKGRYETKEFNGAQIVIDFAHNPASVEEIMNSTKNIKPNRIFTIIGCGGDRDRTKRPIMGNLATSNSDYVIFTNDNPRTEDEKQIMDDILSGVTTDNYEVIHDRQKAIEKAISMLESGDILLLLGKGHENYQIIGRENIHFDDSEEVEKAIKKYQK